MFSKTCRHYGFFLIVLYNTFWFVGIVLGFPLIVLMMLVSEKRRKTFAYRLGINTLPSEIVGERDPDQKNRPLWVHALSVGEVLSAVALVKAFRERFSHHEIYFSVSTQTGFEIAKERLSSMVNAIFFFPYDFFFSVRHIVGAVSPELVVIVETDVWPNFMNAMKRAKVPVILVNARISDKSFRSYRRFLYFSRKLFSGLTKICAQSRQDASRFSSLGVPAKRVLVTGNIKFDQDCSSLSSGEKSELRQGLHIESRAKVLIAGSTHDGEELIFRDIFPRMKEHFSDLILIIAPRDPRRARYVQRLFGEAGVDATLIADIDGPKSDRGSDVLIVDRIGLLSRLYGLADIAFVGGSLASFGGHNPLEPAAFSIPILFGSDMSDFKQISQMLVNSGAAIKIKDQESLLHAVVEIFRKKNMAVDMGKRAFDVFCDKQGAVDRTMEVIKGTLEPDSKIIRKETY